MQSSMCGDWARNDILRSWPEPIALELITFVWPITSESELQRLLGLEHAAPVSVVGGEFTAAVRAENERVHREVTLSVDLRPSLVPGVHALLDMRLVLHRKRWHRAYIFPPCTHQTLRATPRAGHSKRWMGGCSSPFCSSSGAIAQLLRPWRRTWGPYTHKTKPSVYVTNFNPSSGSRL